MGAMITLSRTRFCIPAYHPDTKCQSIAMNMAKFGQTDGSNASKNILQTAQRRGAGVVERGGLENRCARERTQGSNPCLSASRLFQCPAIDFAPWGIVKGSGRKDPTHTPFPCFAAA